MPDAPGRQASTPGNTGPSAYDLARQHGFQGSESAWLESLKGETGNRALPLVNRGTWLSGSTYNPSEYVFATSSAGSGTSVWLLKDLISFLSLTQPKDDTTHWMEALAAPGAGLTPSTRAITTRYSLTGGGDLSADRTLNLVGDVASPGNNKTYGTDGSGVRGWYASLSGGGVTDGDKGDIVVSGTGAVWTIDSDVVTYAKMQNVSATSRFLGRITAGAGDPEELTAANAKTILALTSSDVGLGSVTNDAQTKAAIVPNTVPSAAQILLGNAGGTAYTPVSLSGPVSVTSLGVTSVGTLNQDTTGSAAKWTTARNLAGNSVDGSSNVAFANKFIVQGTSDTGLSGAQFLGSLGTGILKNTTATGVLSIAIAADFPTLNQSTTGSAATLTTPRSIYGNNFDGSAALAQIIASTFGGTGNGFTKFSGPTTSEKTKTLRDATDTILELGGSYTPTGVWTSLNLVTPVLGTPASGNLPNCTGLPFTGLTGQATNAQLPTSPTLAGLLTLFTGTNAIAPLNIPAGTLKTTSADGDIESDADCFYGSTDAGNRGYIPVRHIIRADSTVTQANDTNPHAIFTTPANGRLTLEVGTYNFHGVLTWTAMSATSGNLKVDVLGAGTATTGSWLWGAVGGDANTGAVGSLSGGMFVTSASPASIVANATNTTCFVTIDGSFEVTVAGTIIPTQTQANAAAAVLSIGSFIELWRVGSITMTSVGQWD